MLITKKITEAETVQAAVDFCLSWLEESQYTLTIDTDMSAWADFLGEAPANPLVNPTFDPRFSRLSPGNSFWLDIRLGSETVATSTARLFVTDDYLSLKRSMKLWYEEPAEELAIVEDLDMPVIAGRVGHEGGLWVHPDHRKRGLSVILPHLNRALCFREWDIDWQTGATSHGIAKSRLPERAYGFPHVVPCFEGYFPVLRRLERLYITYMSRAELVAGLDLEAVARLLPDSDRQMGHPAVLAKKG